MSTILCVGRAVWDHIFFIDSLPLPPGKVSATNYREAGGGPAATAAVAIARLGGNPMLWCKVGNDNTGNNIAHELEAYGVDISEICIVPEAQSAVAAILVDTSGERSIAAYSGSNLYRSTDSLPKTLPPNTSMVLADIRWPEGAQYVLELANRLAIPSVLDIEKTDYPELKALISIATYAVFSEDGLKSFTHETEHASALLKASQTCRGTVSVTVGTEGCMWLEDKDVMHQPSFRVKAVDTTGAGDVFHGALALCLSRGNSFAEAARFASAAAALKCTKPGGREGIPDENTLLGFLNDN